MNHMTYMMRDQVRDFVPNLDLAASRQHRKRQWKKLRPVIEIAAFSLAVSAYIIALSLMT
jgi:hypothetical protein